MTSQTRPSGKRTEAAGAAPPQVIGTPDRETLIREQAYYLYERGGCQPGSALSDWLAAEAAIDQAAQAGAAAPRTGAARRR